MWGLAVAPAWVNSQIGPGVDVTNLDDIEVPGGVGIALGGGVGVGGRVDVAAGVRTRVGMKIVAGVGVGGAVRSDRMTVAGTLDIGTGKNGGKPRVAAIPKYPATIVTKMPTMIPITWNNIGWLTMKITISRSRQLRVFYTPDVWLALAAGGNGFGGLAYRTPGRPGNVHQYRRDEIGRHHGAV